ncbi:MAG: putative transport system permease protein [Verrucomicrobiota bacterium]
MNPIRLFHWQTWRYLAHHRLLTLLNVFSIAIGVAVFLAIQLANASASRAFSATVEVVAGKAQLEVNAPANDLPDDIFPSLQQTRGVMAATPLVRGLVTLPDFPGEYLDVLGLDIFTNAPFRTFQLTNFAGQTFDLTQWLGLSNSIAITGALAQRIHLHGGDALRVQVNGRERLMRVGFVLNTSALPAANEHLGAVDIGWAQDLFGMRGRLSSIQLQINPTTSRPDLIRRLAAQVPADIEITAPTQRSEQVDKMLASFQLNLMAMSLVALFVGAFLIFNTTSASVARRRREIGILRSLGVSRSQIGAIFLGEALIAIVSGTLLGLALGTLLAHGLIGAVSETVSSLYVLVSVREVAVNGTSYIAAAALGAISGILAAFVPACGAALTAPVAALHPEVAPQKNAISPFWNAIGITALAAAIFCSLMTLRTGPAWLSFVAAFLCLAGMSCFAPWIGRTIAMLVRTGSRRRFVEPQIAALNLCRSLARNSVTIAALASAVAMSIGVGVMIFSFRNTVKVWIDQTLLADFFITPASNEIAGPTSFLTGDVISFFQSAPAVSAVDTFHYIEVPFRGTRMSLAGIRAAGPRTFVFLQPNRADLMHRFRTERCVIVSESFARRNRIRTGDLLEIATPSGSVQLPVLALFYDYTRDQGIVFTNEKNLMELFHDDRINSIGIYLKAKADPNVLLADFRSRFNGRGEFAVYANKALRARVFEIFDQAFALTHVLRVIAIIVAISGIFLSLMTLIVERSRVLGLMRAIGLSPRQLRRIVILESLLVGAAASVLGIISGIALSVILTSVVNRAFFGWTIRLEMPWLMLVTTPLWILLTTICAALIPAIRASRLNLAETLRSE